MSKLCRTKRTTFWDKSYPKKVFNFHQHLEIKEEIKEKLEDYKHKYEDVEHQLQ